jgi:hypothetical protein
MRIFFLNGPKKKQEVPLVAMFLGESRQNDGLHCLSFPVCFSSTDQNEVELMLLFGIRPPFTFHISLFVFS